MNCFAEEASTRLQLLATSRPFGWEIEIILIVLAVSPRNSIQALTTGRCLYKHRAPFHTALCLLYHLNALVGFDPLPDVSFHFLATIGQ